MTFKKYFYLLTISLSFVGQTFAYASEFSVPGNRKSKNQASIQDSLNWSVSFMKKIFNGSGEWFMTNESFQKSIKGVIDYAENDPIDTVVVNMNHLLKSDSIPRIFNRKAENIPNKKNSAGLPVCR